MFFVITFLLGACVGSFVNVLIDRTIAGEDWVRGRSHCDHCKKTLAWYDMIPIVSYLFFLGKSRCCKKRLSYRYPLVETLVGMLFVWWLMAGFFFFNLVSAPLLVIQPAFWLLTGIILLILGLADLFYGVVLVGIVWFASVATLLYRLVLWYYGAYQMLDLQNSVIMAAVFYGLFWLLWKTTRGRGMAEGDMYMALYMGLLLGYPKGMVAMMGSFVLGAVVGVLLILTGIRSRKDSVPFVPFMVVATTIALIWGEVIIRYVG